MVRQARSTREKCICAQQSNRAQHAGTGKRYPERTQPQSISPHAPSRRAAQQSQLAGQPTLVCEQLMAGSRRSQATAHGRIAGFPRCVEIGVQSLRRHGTPVEELERSVSGRCAKQIARRLAKSPVARQSSPPLQGTQVRDKSLDIAATLPCLGYTTLRGDCENIALATLLVGARTRTATSGSM